MTSTTCEDEIILKTDILGRVRMPREKRELILDRFEESGMSGQSFATHIGVKYQTFASWVQKRRRERGEYPQSKETQAKAPISLLEAIVEEPSPKALAGGLEVQSVGGIKIRLSSVGEIPLAVSLLRQLADAKL